MMVVSKTLLRKQSTSQKGQSLLFTLVAGRSNGCSYMVQQPWFLVSRTYIPANTGRNISFVKVPVSSLMDERNEDVLRT